MKQITVELDKRYQQDSFLIVRKESSFYNINEKYKFVDFANNTIGIFYLKDITKFFACQTPTYVAFLDKNCDKEIYISIQKEVYNSLDSTVLSALTFSNQKPISETLVNNYETV